MRQYSEKRAREVPLPPHESLHPPEKAVTYLKRTPAVRQPADRIELLLDFSSHERACCCPSTSSTAAALLSHVTHLRKLLIGLELQQAARTRTGRA
jgi:hypothetical protein